MPVFKLLKYDPDTRCHIVHDEAGEMRLVDVMVNGDLPEGTTPESLVGKTVECDYECPYITIAMGAKVVEPQFL